MKVKIEFVVMEHDDNGVSRDSHFERGFADEGQAETAIKEYLAKQASDLMGPTPKLFVRKVFSGDR